MLSHCTYSKLNTQAPEGVMAWQASVVIPMFGTDM